MCEQTEIDYLDGEVVWVKLGSCWWPGAVVAKEKLPPDVLPSFRKPPIACVKFFQEDAYEFVKNINNIYKYNCSRKNEFINKGLYLFRSRHGHMEKFPDDVIRAETAVGGDIEILTRDEFQEVKKESYAGLFGNPKKTPGSVKKGKSGRGRQLSESSSSTTPRRQIKEKTDYKVHILVQGSKSTPSVETSLSEVTSTPSTSVAEVTTGADKVLDNNSTEKEDQDNKDSNNTEDKETSKPITIPATPLRSPVPSTAPSSSGILSCHACPFTTTRLNVLILHNKTHSVTFVPYTPSPVRKKIKSPVKSTPNSSKTPKPRKPRKEKTEKLPKKMQGKKRPSVDKLVSVEVKKPKTDEEIKSSLLADWDDDVDEDSNDESSIMVSAQSPEVPVGAESPAVPTPAELPSAQVPTVMSPAADKKSNSSPSTEKPESSSDSKYEFCEDEDWPEETDFGRKIPRVKNPVRTEDPKSVGLDEEEVAREVAELLNKTAVPELPSVPEPHKFEENFPEPPIVKSPDKIQDNGSDKVVSKSVTETLPTKAIFKTKTFFRSRHSRSQDAIGKYVAEQLNAVERMDITESEINGSEAVSSPEARDSPPIEPVKVARLAPKIQLKKMKAEAAQLREKEKLGMELGFDPLYSHFSNNSPSDSFKEIVPLDENAETDKCKVSSQSKSIKNFIYPTREIKPLIEEIQQNFTEEEAPFTDKNTFADKEIAKDSLTQEKETMNSKFREDMLRQDEEIFHHHKEGTGFVGDSNELDKEACNSEKVIIQPVFENEKCSELEIEKPDANEVHTPVLDNEISKTEEEIITSETEAPRLEKETANYESQSTSNEKQLIGDSNEISEEFSNQKPEMEDPLLPITALHTPSFQENEKLEALNNEQSSAEKQKQMSPYMNESTASAVDALLSVSRETDRVPKVVTNDLPEDLFEDDQVADSIENVNDVKSNLEEKMDTQNNFVDNNGFIEHIETENIHNHVEKMPGFLESSENNVDSNLATEISHNEEIIESRMDVDKPLDKNDNTVEESEETVVENVPSESDLQVAEALINLPATALQNTTSTGHKDNLILPFSLDHESSQEETVHTSENVVINETEIGYQENEVETETVEHISETVVDSEDLNARFETEQEKSENLNAAQSLVQMSESVEHKINMVEALDTNEVRQPNSLTTIQNNGVDTIVESVEQNISVLTNENISLKETPKPSFVNQQSSRLLKILEEPSKPRTITISKSSPTKQPIQSKEKILNFDVAKSVLSKNKSPKQKIIIRRNPTTNKTVLNKVTEATGPDKIILSRSGNLTQEGSSMQTFTIQTSPDTPSDANTIIIQQKIRKVAKPAIIQPKLQKIKPQTSLIAPANEIKTINKSQSNDEVMFDINSMPIVLSEDLLTPESIEKMPVVMSDGNIISQPQNATKVIKPKPNVEQEKVVITSSSHKPEVKTLLLNPGGEVSKSATPNILSKSSKLRGAKPMLVIDKATGKQKIIMTKSEPIVKELKQTQQTIIQPVSNAPKTEKFIILPTQNSTPNRPTRTQKIVIDPQTGKAHMFVAKGSDSPLNASDNKPVSAKLMPSNSDAAAPGNTVMIITNAQGAQSRIVLTPRHEKILFPNKQQPNLPQLKTITHRITPNTSVQKTLVTTIASTKTPTISPVKAPARIVPKQNKSAIITSKGQLIVGGRVATTAQNIAPMPELRPVQPKRIVTSEPKKTLIAAPKTNSEPIIFLQQKSGAVMQLTAAQFEHLQRTGQLIHKSVPVQEKVVIQKAKPAVDPGPSIKRGRKPTIASSLPAKKVKQEVPIAPAVVSAQAAPAPLIAPILAPAPPSAPAPAALVTVQPTNYVPEASNVISVASSSASSGYSELENFEELLPSTAIVRQAPEPEPAPAPEPVVEPAPPQEPPAAISDQILAVPGEHFGALAGTFYLCIEDNGSYTPIDNRPLVLENNQLVPMETPPPERRDILEAALANSDVFHAETPSDAPDFRDLNANVSVHCRVSETSTTLNQPIMTPVEVPSSAHEAAVPASLEAGLAVIGCSPHSVPTSLELPITVTDPRIAARAADPRPDIFEAPISMPLLTDEEPAGKSMPILTGEAELASRS